MPRSIALLFVASLCTVGCGGPVVRGGRTVAAGNEPAGRPLAAYNAVDCRDASGGPVEYHSRLFIVDAGGDRIAVETRTGFDSLVVENSFIDGGSRVFQAVVESPDGKQRLHEFRVPSGPPGPGKLLVTSSFKETPKTGGGFKALAQKPSISCRLGLTGSNPETPAEAGSGAAADGGPGEADALPPVPDRLGVPLAQKSYQPNDHVAVDRDGAVVRARVVQAVKGRYYVEYDAGGSEWIDKSRIRGKIR